MRQFPPFSVAPLRVETLPSQGTPTGTVTQRRFARMTDAPRWVEDLSSVGSAGGAAVVVLPPWLFEPLVSLTG